jgi:AmmeMemoRadiSam system protein B
MAQRPVDVVVVFGAVHTPLPIDSAALDSHRWWAVPGGESEAPAEVERHLAEQADWFRVDDRFHVREHAVEVELPLIQAAWPNAGVLPIEIPTVESAAETGRRTAQQVIAAGLNAVYLASSDLTHYGSHYGFAPVGRGIEALQWAKENDRRLLQVVTDMTVEAVVPEVKAHFNACGGGAIAAMMAACREVGATRGCVLRHANSYETLAAIAPQPPNNAVGYAAVVVG